MSGFLPIKISLLAFGGLVVLVLVDNGVPYLGWWHITFIDERSA